MAIAYYYDETKNPGGEAFPASIPGVPLTDLDEDWLAQQPAYIKASIDASPMYRKTKPDSAKRAPEQKE